MSESKRPVGGENTKWAAEPPDGVNTSSFIQSGPRKKSHTSCSLLLFRSLSSSRRPLFAFEDSGLVIRLILRTSKRQSGHDLIDLLPTLASRLSPPLLLLVPEHRDERDIRIVYPS